MPNRDGTGPLGKGPGSGRGVGQGQGVSATDAANQEQRGRHGRGGQGRGQGGQRGRRNMFQATGLTGRQRAAMADNEAAATPQDSPPQSELQVLQAQVEAASAALDQIRQRRDEVAAKQAPAVSPGQDPASTDA